VLFRRRRPLHEQLAEAGGVLLDAQLGGPVGLTHDPFGGPTPLGATPLGETGVHGVPRARRWDAVGTTEAPALRGDAVHFVALADGTLVVDEDVPDGALGPLADAIEASLTPPYRAEAVRREGTVWAVAARRIEVVELPGVEGEELEVTVRGLERSLVVDGERSFGLIPALEQLAEHDAVVRGVRIDEALWEIKVDRL
jgi:hypothetical protein